MSTRNDDEAILHRLGYAQVLYREMGGFANFAISFTIISILAGCLTSYYIAFNYGGPVAITWGWLLVGAFCVLVAMAMGEIASAMPTAGALYFWASKLGGPSWGWFTGWFNLVGQIAVTAAIDYGAAIFTTALLNLWFPDAIGTDAGAIFITYTVIIALHLAINLLGVNLLALLNTVSAWWHMIGVLVIVVVLFVVPDQHQSAAFVFGQTIDNSGFDGAPFWLVFGLGLLMAQYTITGYDASAHMSEETRLASRSAAWGMVMSVVASVVFGFILLVAVTFAVPDVQGTLDALANAVVYIWTTSLGTGWAEFLLLIAVVAQFFCGTASVTSASRMMFAFSRDRAVPFSRVWRRVSARRVPIYAVTAIGVLAWALMLPTLGQRRDRLPRRHVDRRDRPVHRVRDPDLPADPGGRPLRARGVEPRQPLQVDLATGRHLDRGGLHPVPAPGVAQGDPRSGLRLERGQLRAADGRGRGDPVRRLVPALGPQVVHRPRPRGRLRRGAHRHRAGDGALMPSRRGMLTLEQLATQVEDGSIDTVLVAFTDMQGRLAGKRCAADYFLDEVAPHAAEACNYLLAVDVEMNTVDGYAMSSWERGYGDFVLRPDLTTLRMVPVARGHRAGAVRRRVGRRRPRRSRRRGRSCAASSTGSPSAGSSPTSAPSWSSCCSPTPSTRRGSKDYRDLRARQPLQRRLLDARHRPGRAGAAAHPQRDGRAPGWWSSRPRASATSASTRSPSATPTRSPPATTTRSTRPAPRRSPTRPGWR